MAYDPKCNELAEYFLLKSSSQADKEGLSQHIQDAVEDWLRENGYGPDNDSEAETEE
jgi:hypothetical protein